MPPKKTLTPQELEIQRTLAENRKKNEKNKEIRQKLNEYWGKIPSLYGGYNKYKSTRVAKFIEWRAYCHNNRTVADEVNKRELGTLIEELNLRLFIDELGFGGYYGEMDKLVQLGNYYKTTGDKEIVYRDRVVETTVIDGISIDKIKDLLKVVGTYTDNPTLLRKHVSDYAELEEKYKNKENEKEEVKKEVERWKRDNAKTLENLNTANNELAISKEAVRTLTNNISLNLNPEIDGLKKDLEDKEKELAQSKLREEELKKTSVNTEAVEKEKELTTANNRLTRQNKAWTEWFNRTDWEFTKKDDFITFHNYLLDTVRELGCLSENGKGVENDKVNELKEAKEAVFKWTQWYQITFGADISSNLAHKFYKDLLNVANTFNILTDNKREIDRLKYTSFAKRIINHGKFQTEFPQLFNGLDLKGDEITKLKEGGGW